MSDDNALPRCAHNHIEHGLTHCLVCGAAIAPERHHAINCRWRIGEPCNCYVQADASDTHDKRAALQETAKP